MPKTATFNLEILPHVLGTSTESQDSAKTLARKALIKKWSEHPWNWLMGEDLESREVAPGLYTKRIIWTTDERDQAHPIKAFPNMEFLYRWVCLLFDANIKELLANKPRQMIFTTTTLLVMDWLGRFHPSRALLLSKNTEDLAEKLLKEKVRDVHERLPAWVKEALPMSESPQNKATYEKSKSVFYAVPQNVASRHAVGGTASMLLVDEAGLQEMFQVIWAKAAPMAAKLVGITTAQFGNKGAADYKQMMDEDMVPAQLVPELLNPDGPWPEMDRSVAFYESRKDVDLKGFRVRKTKRGYTVVDICLEADPTKRAPEVLEELERRQPNRREFLREYRGDWTSPSGASYYSEYEVYGGRDAYRVECKGLIPGVPIGCGWDFGTRNPCASFGQRDPFTGRIFILRSIRCPGADTYVLRDLVLVLRGQLDISDVSEKSGKKVYDFLDSISEDPRLPPWPWFGTGQHFLDFSSREALRDTATVEGTDSERYDAEVLEARGIFLTILPTGVAARENIVRKQLKPMEDGLPGLLIDPGAPEVTEMFSGGLVYKNETKADPLPNTPKKDGKYHDLNDATGYLIVGLAGRVSDAPVQQSSDQPGALIPFRTLKKVQPPRPKAPRQSWARPGQAGALSRSSRDGYSRR